MAEIDAYTRKEWGKDQRDEYLEKIVTKFAWLCAAPEMGVDRGCLRPGLRSSPVGSHVVYCLDMEEHIRIMRVLHHSRDAERHLSTWEN